VALGQQNAMEFHFHRGRRLATYRNPQRRCSWSGKRAFHSGEKVFTDIRLLQLFV
jgi:hypothetical protein